MEDFPAAHSMDTTWFAIDRDGNLALFDSGEAGAVPEETVADQGSPFEDELRALPATGVKLDPEGHRVGTRPGYDHLEVNDFNVQYNVLAFVKDLEAVRDLMPRLKAREVPATKGVALIVKLADRAAFDELHTRGACLGCQSHWRDDDDDDDIDIATHGVFHYTHTCENWIAGPYARTAVPAKPLALDQLPAGLRDGAIRYPGRFADAVQLQPAEHWHSVAWGASWLATDHKTVRAFPDRLDDYREELAQRGDGGDDDGLVFEKVPDEE
jgi:hypothetical protein